MEESGVTQAKPPIIGITTYSRGEAGEFSLPGAYVDAVQAAGGTPLLIPPNQPDPARVLDILDGLIFAGGGDINPALYGGEPHPMVYLVDEERDQCELALAKQAIASDVPTLGICRGMQVLSVASGAELVTHVPDIYGDSVVHRLDHPRRPVNHPVRIQPQSQLAAILGETSVEVVSWHHQAIRTLPAGWTAVAAAADGLVEALEHQQHPWMIGVQWHPELSPGVSAHQRLFQALVAIAAKKQLTAASI